jgi:gamma-glutamylcysteine synthetase
MSSAAFHIGLMGNLQALENLLQNDTVIYGNGYNAAELRDLFSRRDLPDFVDKGALKSLILQILQLAEAGLTRRGYGENVYLQPLYYRAQNLLSPAKQMLGELESGRQIEDIILEYGALDGKRETKERVRAFA